MKKPKPVIETWTACTRNGRPLCNSGSSANGWARSGHSRYFDGLVQAAKLDFSYLLPHELSGCEYARPGPDWDTDASSNSKKSRGSWAWARICRTDYWPTSLKLSRRYTADSHLPYTEKTRGRRNEAQLQRKDSTVERSLNRINWLYAFAYLLNPSPMDSPRIKSPSGARKQPVQKGQFQRGFQYENIPRRISPQSMANGPSISRGIAWPSSMPTPWQVPTLLRPDTSRRVMSLSVSSY